MKIILIILSLCTFLFYSCKDEDIINNPDLASTQASQDNLYAEKIFTDVGFIIKQGMEDNSQRKSCPNYNLINANDADIDTLTINFGNTNCLSNGQLRRGIINVTFTKEYNDSLSILTSSFDNYYVNDYKVEGEIIIKNKGKNNEGNMCFDINIRNASVYTKNGTINWQSLRNKEILEGQSTLNISDDRYKITGSSSGNGVNGNSFNVTITEALNIDLSCLPSCIIKSGSAIVFADNYSERLIEYGDSLCDCNANIIIDGKVYPVIIGN